MTTVRVLTTITYTGVMADVARLRTVPRLEAYFFNKVVKPAMREALEWWHSTRYPLRFKTSAYILKNRNRKYNERKQRAMGHRQPLVFTGELRDLTVGASNRNVVVRRPRGAGKVIGEIKLRGARKVNRMRRDQRERIRKELYLLIGKDWQVLTKRMQDNVARLWAKNSRLSRFSKKIR